MCDERRHEVFFNSKERLTWLIRWKSFWNGDAEMYLVDSSVWIEYLRAKGSALAKQRTREILQKEEAVCCGIVVVEVLRGARNEKDFLDLKESLLFLPQIPISEEVIARASEWGYALDRKGKIVSTTDLFIAAAAYKQATILHSDSHFEVIAQEFGLDQERLT
jgi:predicted nucleic acid-binding protein